MEPIIGAGAPATEAVKDSNTQSFAADVLDASREVPVVVDFWAPWCGPCKTLGPIIERAVAAAGGTVKLVKINIDENQELAGQLRIQSIPAVMAFKDGQPVDGFVGALPESQVKSFIDQLAGQTGPSPVDQALEQATALMAEGQHQEAGALYSQVLQHEPGNVAAIAGMARCLIAAGDLDGARQLLDTTPEDLAKHADIAGARTALELADQAQQGGDGGDLDELRDRLAADANDHQARFDLAIALFGGNQRQAAVDELLEIIGRARQWNDEAARKELVKLFEAMGFTDPITVDARGRLSSLLFS